jgi:mannitol-specific phosphotransferase system IIBC component
MYAANKASDDAAEARAQQERQMQMAREEAARPGAPREANKYVTAAVQQNRQRVASMQGMGSTVTGAGIFDSNKQSGANGVGGIGTKKNLGA